MENITTTPPPADALVGKREILRDAIYLTEEAALVCCVQPSTIRAAVRRGLIKGKGRPFRIRGSELFKLVA